MPHIASTLTSSTRYVEWIRGGDGRLVEGKSVTIKGGFGLANDKFVTPKGAILSEVNDEELAFLEANTHFQEHVKNGFITVIRGRAVDGEKVASSMKLGDASQPLNPQMFKDGAKDDPSVLRVSTQVKAA